VRAVNVSDEEIGSGGGGDEVLAWLGV
jgi:hypothetical protein